MPLFSAIRPEERRSTFTAMVTLFGFMASHALLETARDALFLADTSAMRLPWVYLAIAMVSLVLSQVYGADAAKQGRGLSAWLAGAGAITLGFWALAFTGQSWVYYGLYVWSGVIATLILIRFWLLLGDRFTATEAKRVFAVIGTGSVLGAIVGSAAAAVLSIAFGAHHLILASAVLMLGTAVVSGRVAEGTPSSKTPERSGPGVLGRIVLRLMGHPVEREDTGRRTLAESLSLVTSRPYARRVALVVVLSTVTLTVADFVFKSAIDSYVEPADMGTVFASIYLVLNVLSLVTQVFVVGWVLRHLSLTSALAVLPALILGGAIGLVVLGGLAAAVAIKGVDGALRHTLHRTSTELLYVPMTEHLRNAVKTLIDVVGQRGGQALSSIVILGLVALGAPPAVFGVMLAVLAVIWVVAALELRRHYVNLFRGTLERGLVQTRFDFPALDVASLESLTASLNSTNDAEVLAALDILAEKEKISMVQVFILFHPSVEVVERAAGYFADANRVDFVGVARRRYNWSTPAVQAVLLRALSRVDPNDDELHAALRSESAVVRATALVTLIEMRKIIGDEARRALAELTESGSLEAQEALARTLAYSTAPEIIDATIELAAHDEVEVRALAATAMSHRPHARYLPVLLQHLATHRTRRPARDAFAALGEPALTALAAALRDFDLTPRIRQHLPKAIVRFEAGRAAEMLLGHIPEEPDGVVRYKILQALSQLRLENPNLKLNAERLSAGTDRVITRNFELLESRMVLEQGVKADPGRATDVQQLLVKLLRDKERNGIDRLMRVLSLRFAARDVEQIWRGLGHADRETRSSSRELLESMLPRAIREPVMALVDDAPDAERLARAGAAYRASQIGYEEVLRRLLADRSTSIRSLVVYHIGELGLTELQVEIQSLGVPETSVLGGIVRSALGRLSAGRQELAYET